MNNKLKNKILNIIYGILVIIIFYIIGKKLQYYFISKIVIGEKQHNLLYEVIGNMFYYIFLIGGIIIAFTFFGFNLSTIFIFLGSIGLALALAFRNTLSQAISGVFIIFFNLFQLNDLIEINEIRGHVKEFNLLKTTLINFDKIQTIISNSDFIEKSFINYTKTENIYHKIIISVSSNNNIDYNILMNNIINRIKYESKYYNNVDDIIVNIDNIEEYGTQIAVHIPIKSKDMNIADMELKTIIRNLMSEDNILLLDKAYIDKKYNNIVNNNS